MKRTLYVIPCKREFVGVETWRVVVDATSTTGPITRTNKATDYKVQAERDPDVVCKEIAIAGETNHSSAVAANKHAHNLAKVLACGSAVACLGIVTCIKGAVCPYGLK